MNLLSRTDLDIAPVGIIPTMGPAGSIVVDPVFGNKIVRMTDENTLQLGGAKPSQFCAAGIGGSADVNVWNTDSTMLYVEDSGGAGGILGFDPTTLAVTRLFPKWRPNALVFSKVWADVAFVFSGTRWSQYDLSNRTLDEPPPPTVVCDFSAQLPAAATWKTVGGVEDSDTIFSAAFSTDGQQGTGVYVCVFTVGKGYRTWNTQTGAVTGTWGTFGQVTCPDRVFIHNVKSNKAPGQWMCVATTTRPEGGPPLYFWNHDTLRVENLGDVAWGGHWCGGYGRFFNNDSSPTIPFGAHVQRLFASLADATRLANPSPDPATQVGLDDHPSFNGPPSSMMATTTTSMGKSPATGAWWDEVLGFDLSGNGKVYRFCHTFTSGKSQADKLPAGFYADNAIGSVDQRNKFIAFTSDWNQSLLNKRADVFVVQVR
jgi:hypothetical protein